MTQIGATNHSPKTVINETLCFLQNAYNSYTKDQIETSIADFYDAEEIITAKDTLTDCAKELNLEREVSKHVPQRRTARGSNSADKQTVKDLIEIWDVLDLHSSTQIQFVAKNCFRIAPIGHEVSAENLILMQAISSLSVEMSSMRKSLGGKGKEVERNRLVSTAETTPNALGPLFVLLPTAPSTDDASASQSRGGLTGGGDGDGGVGAIVGGAGDDGDISVGNGGDDDMLVVLVLVMMVIYLLVMVVI